MHISSSQVHIAAYHESEYYCYTILVANTENYPTSFSIVINELESKGNLTASVLFESRNVIVSQGNLNDMISGFGTHVYRIYYSQPNGGPTIHPGNLIRNPSFEEQSDVGMADGMWPHSEQPTNIAIVDPTYAFHGQYSQRLTNANRGTSSSITLSNYIVALAPGNYEMTFMAYSNSPLNISISAGVSCLPSSPLSFNVQNNKIWNTFTTSIAIPNPAQCSYTVELAQKGSLWIDFWQIYPK